MKLSYPVKTSQGETVTIVEKRVAQGDEPRGSMVLVSEDGRLFQPSGNGLAVVEISAAAENDAAEAASAQEPVTEPDLSQTIEEADAATLDAA